MSDCTCENSGDYCPSGEKLASGREKTRKIYVASRFKNREIVRDVIAPRLVSAGWNPIQTWPDEHESCSDSEAAIRDINEVNQADVLLLFTDGCEQVPGGMHHEAGYAHAKGKQVWVVGPRVNVFHSHPEIAWFPSLASLYRCIEDPEGL